MKQSWMGGKRNQQGHIHTHARTRRFFDTFSFLGETPPDCSFLLGADSGGVAACGFAGQCFPLPLVLDSNCGVWWGGCVPFFGVLWCCVLLLFFALFCTILDYFPSFLLQEDGRCLIAG